MTKHPTITVEEILSQVPEGVTAIEARDLIRRAYRFADHAHAGQKRKSGEPYIQHPLQVACLLAQLHFESAVIAAGLLHDVLEDCDVTREEMLQNFGREVLVLVEGVTKLEQIEARVKQDSHRARDIQELESLRKLLIAMAEDDIRIIFIKLADRLHNMRTLSALSPQSQERMARETLEIFAPLANRLGIWLWKAELEDLSFRYLNPEMYAQLAEFLDIRRDERQARVSRHKDKLRAALEREGIKAKIKGRPKHIYSIYHKMRRKNVPFNHIYDAQGLRVIVNTELECYHTLGIVHHLWTPVPGEFDDYIAHPKSNGYQSLHTAVIGDEGEALEIQIRTHEMDYVAEYGVAAHWLYKEQGVPMNDQVMDRIASMRQSVQELTEDAGDARDFINSMRSDVFQDRVFTFTPKGKVIDLPLGATPVDFAYYVHTEVGHRCRGARVNGRWTPLDYQLKTGDQVEVITGRKGGPSRDWLNEELGFTKTNRARQKIKQWFRRQSREENSTRGQTIVEKLLKRVGLTDMALEEVAKLFWKRYQQIDDFFAAVGVGDLATETIVNRLEVYTRRREEALELEEPPEVVEEPPPPPPSKSTTDAVTIRGTGGLLTNTARCCKPLPGEDIIGYVTRGRGVTVHRRDCPNILRMKEDDQERIIEVEWGGVEEQTFSVQILINAYDRSGLFHDVSGVVANQNLNMAAVRTGIRDRYNIVPIYVTLDVPNLATLTRVLSKIEQIPNVIETRRIG